MKLKIKLLLLFVIIAKMSFSQVVLNNNSETNGVVSIPKESVFVHFNTSLLFSGEYFYYSVYCLNNTSKKLSNISKVAYVELVGKDNITVFKHKIKLDNGKGYSDFFIPVEISSGNYKLIAYTNWMKNTEIDNWFIADINIINPYKTNKDCYFKEGDKNNLSKENSDKSLEFNLNKSPLELELNKSNYKKREQVTLILNSLFDKNLENNGNYSISVRRKGIIPAPKKTISNNFFKNLTSDSIKISQLKSEIFLPELRGELFQGKVSSANKNISLNNLKIGISIPSENYIFKIANTNKIGEFFFNLDGYYSANDIYVQVLENDSKAYNIELYNPESTNTNNLNFSDFKINPLWKDEILKQSIYNQIESAYFEFKPDSLLPITSKKIYDIKHTEKYKLDDYKRFKTLKETMVEVVKNVAVKRIDKNKSVFEIQGFDFGTNTGIKPLVIIDGIAFQNHTALMDFNAYNIDEITISRDQFVFGLEVFQGLIDIKTIKGVNSDLFTNNSIEKVSIFKPQLQKNYFSQKYSEDNLNRRIPDYRQQLLWIPNLEIANNKKELLFYTSDVEGEYEISIEGFTNEGLSVSITKQFTVN